MVRHMLGPSSTASGRTAMAKTTVKSYPTPVVLPSKNRSLPVAKSALVSCSASLSSPHGLSARTEAVRQRLGGRRSLLRVAATNSGDLDPPPPRSKLETDDAMDSLPSSNTREDGEASADFRWGSFVSKQQELSAAINEAVEKILENIGEDADPELAIIFVTTSFGKEFDQVVPLLRSRLPSLKQIFGSSGFGVVGGGGRMETSEVEGRTGFSLTLGKLPGVEVKVRHTLRSSIPDEDADPGKWASFVGLPNDTHKNTSFVILADPRFSQLPSILKGLDYAFPDSPKIGGVLSVSDRPNKARTMFAWSVDGVSGENKRSIGKARFLAKRRTRRSGRVLSEKESAKASAEGIDMGLMDVTASSVDGDDENPSPSSSQKNTPSSRRASASAAALSAAMAGGSSSSSSSNGSSSRNGRPAVGSSNGNGSKEGESVGVEVPKKMGLLAGVMSWLAKLTEGVREESTGVGLASTSNVADSRERSDASASSGYEQEGVPNGMHMYGAVVLTLHGDVILDTIVSRGYRCPSGSLFRMEKVAGNHIVSIVPLVEGVGALAEGRDSGSSQGSESIILRGDVMIDDDDSDDDDDDDDEGDVDGEYMAFAALADMMSALGQPSSMAEVVNTTVLAVASDSSKATSELTADDFDIMEIEQTDSDTMLAVRGEIRKGYRFKVMVRDKQGIQEDLRDQLLEYKRNDLQAMMMGGSSLPTTFGLLMFSDLERGEALHGEPAFESKLLKTYLPVPISGFFGGAQVAEVDESSNVMEETTVVGILRAAPPDKLL